DGMAVDVPLGPWEQQTRRYQLSLQFDPAALPVEDDVRAARVELLAEIADGTRERRASAALVVRRHATPDFRTVVPESLTRGEKERLGLDSTKTAFAGTGTVSENGTRAPGHSLGRSLAPPAVAGRACSRCGATTRAAHLRFCEACGAPFDGGVPS